jgi:predicted nucleic acid-binding protein
VGLTYFFDTYALIEICNGNSVYLPYLDKPYFTSLMNLYEFYYYLLKIKGEEIAESLFWRFREKVLNVNDAELFFAAKFRRQNFQKNFSFIDAWGYAIAKLNNLKFLTGDKEFKGFDNVEFVK